MAGLTLVVAFWLASGLCGYAIVRRSWPRDGGDVVDAGLALDPLERIGFACVCAVLVAVAANWALSAAAWLTKPGLVVTTLALFAGSSFAIWRDGRARLPATKEAEISVPPRVHRASNVAVALFVVLLVAWVAYAIVRAWYLPVLNHDALAYHLPKAAMIWWAKGAQFFEAADGRISFLGSNYELLIADVLVATGRDRLTLVPSVFFYVVVCILAAACAQRWWGKGAHVVVATAVTASAPVLLLQSVAHKNDVFVAALALAAIIASARFFVRKDRAAGVLAVASFACAVGAKFQGLFPIAGVVVALLATRKHLEKGVLRRDAKLLIAAALASFFLLGGMTYVWNLWHDGSLTGHLNDPVFEPTWGRLINIPLSLYMIVARAFDPDSMSVWVPFQDARWFAPRYEFYFSDFGVLAVIAALAAPIAAFRARHDHGVAARERRFVLWASVSGAVLFMPVDMGPLGICAAYFRYYVFVLPPVAACAAGLISEARVNEHVRSILAFAAIVGFGAYASLCALKDRFAPAGYVADAIDKPTRVIPIWPNRPGPLVDRNAPRDAHVAVDADLDTWFYPAYGAEFTRRLTFIAKGPGPVTVPDDATFVMIDRPWHVVWNAANGNMGERVAGRPSEDDLRVYNALARDPRFKLVWSQNSGAQSVFVRRVR